MSEVKSLETLTGCISAEASLTGGISCEAGLTGSLSVAREYDAYTGDYLVTPSPFDAQTLSTAHKVMSKDVVIEKIPYYETGNTSDGITAYIAKEIRHGY